MDPSQIVWRANAEKPLAEEWATGNAADVSGGKGTATSNSAWANSSRIKQVASPVVVGAKAYSLTVRSADRDAYTNSAQRTELGQNNSARAMADGVDRQMYAGQERWIGWQMRIPAGYVCGTWNAVMQLKGEGTGNGPLSVYFESGKLRLKKSLSQSYGSIDVAQVWGSSAATVRDKWLKLLIHVKWSMSSDGFYELYGDLQDGRGFCQLKSKTPGWTLKRGSDGKPVKVGARIGIYRLAVSHDDSLYYDGYNVSKTRADCEAIAFGV